MQKNMI